MTLAEERDFVFAKKPLLGKLYTRYKNHFWPTYLKDIERRLPKKIEKEHAARTAEFADACRQISTPLFGTTLTKKIIATLKKRRFVSTSDHHGVLCHSFFLNFNLLRALFPPDEPVISFTCGGTSFSNSSYPRGIFFHDTSLNQIKAPLIPWKYRQTSVYGQKALKDADLGKLQERVLAMHLPDEKKSKLIQLYETYRRNRNIKSASTFSEQSSVMTHLLWKGAGMEEDVIYLECESIVRRLLLDVHLSRDSTIYRLLFDEAYRSRYLKHFQGVIGAHRASGGTELFWYRDLKQRRKVRLTVTVADGQAVLRSEDGLVMIPLTPKSMRAHLSEHTLLPCLALCYSIVSFYYGITLGGGFSQIQYLGDMKNAWTALLSDVHDPESEVCEEIQTDIFTGDFVIAGITDGTSTVPATLVDIYLWGDESTRGRIQSLFGKVTIGDTLDIMIPQLAHTLDPSSGPVSVARNFPASLHVHS